MKTIHIANTDFEFELDQNISLPIETTLKKNPIFFQLQFIPLLFAGKEDLIAVTDLPDRDFLDSLLSLGLWKTHDFPHFILLSTLEKYPGWRCQSWGASKRVEEWARQHEIDYRLPNMEIVKEINSKDYTYKSGLNLAGSELIFQESELQAWLRRHEGPVVIKSCFGLSGSGNRLYDSGQDLGRLLSFCEQEWKKGYPVLAEPWLDRIFDFSTQWHIDEHKEIHFEGATVFETDSRGMYKGTIAGPEEIIFSSFIPFLIEHKNIAKKTLTHIAAKGYFGPIGFDALLYKSKSGTINLYPIVEINGRQTVSLAALKMQQKWFPYRSIKMAYECIESPHISLLPTKIGQKTFKRKLVIRHFAQ